MNIYSQGNSAFYPFDNLPVQTANSVSAMKTRGAIPSINGIVNGPPLSPKQAFDLRYNVKSMVLTLPGVVGFPISLATGLGVFDVVSFVSGDCIVKRYITNNSAEVITNIKTNQHNNIKFKAKSPKNYSNAAVDFTIDFSLGYWGFDTQDKTSVYRSSQYYRPVTRLYIPAISSGITVTGSLAIAGDYTGYSSNNFNRISLDHFRYNAMPGIPFYIKDFSSNNPAVFDIGSYIIKSPVLFPIERIDEIYFNTRTYVVGDTITITCPATDPDYDDTTHRVGFADLKKVCFKGAEPVTSFTLSSKNNNQVKDTVTLVIPANAKSGPIGFYLVENTSNVAGTSDYFETLNEVVIN
jgi:hypothetical protein